MQVLGFVTSTQPTVRAIALDVGFHASTQPTGYGGAIALRGSDRTTCLS
ncbi:hypothetical protein [Microseira wollei]|nr:hypothetical protein [Microseira wollei]